MSQRNSGCTLATEFIERALSLIPTDGFVAMLLRCDFDSAKTRGHLFARCPEFAKKLTLVERIRWFEDYRQPQLQSCLVSVVGDA